MHQHSWFPLGHLFARNTRYLFALALTLFGWMPLLTAEDAIDLWSHCNDTDSLNERGLDAQWILKPEKQLWLESIPASPGRYHWLSLPAPANGWGLVDYQKVTASITNRGGGDAEVFLWAVGSQGWGAVNDFAVLSPNETREFSVNLRKTFPDGTAKLDPSCISEIRIMLKTGKEQQEHKLSVSRLIAKEQIKRWIAPKDRLTVPEMESAPPTAGKRVRFRLPGEHEDSRYSVLYLPEDWTADGSYPVVVEFPGNIFFTPRCFSTGRPEQCAIGYGMTEGKAIWLSLPFVKDRTQDIVEDGFGDPEETARYAEHTVKFICEQLGGDLKRVILTGFSRGSIACGYIGLRDQAIADLWLGIHGCQHYDGSPWKQSGMKGAVKRAPRFRGKSIFQTDNARSDYAEVVDATSPDVKWHWVKSGLKAHDTAMFLDSRASTQQLRKWYQELVAQP